MRVMVEYERVLRKKGGERKMEKGCKGTSGGVSGVCACVCTCMCRRGGLKHLNNPALLLVSVMLML